MTLYAAYGSNLFVAIYDLTRQDESALDEWEGVNTNLYSKIRVRVDTLSGVQLCYVYVLNSFEGGNPSKRYLEIMLNAALEAGAPSDYIDMLKGYGEPS